MDRVLIRDIAVMFYFEDTTTIQAATREDDHLLILDGTTCLDDLTEAPLLPEKGGFQKFIEHLYILFRIRG